MSAVPAYVARHSGPVLLCGPAPSLFDDFARARRAYPEAELIALSWAIRAVRAPHCVTLHFEKAHEMKALGAADHPGHTFLLHSQVPTFESPAQFPAVDHFWSEAREVNNTAAGAIVIAEAMGFTEIILAGVLLDGTPGYAVETEPFTPCCWNEGNGERARIEGGYVMETMRRLARGSSAKIYAMSGAPRWTFGLPPRVAALEYDRRAAE